MRNKTIKSALITVGAIIGMTAIAAPEARSQNLVRERGTAGQLTGIEQRTISDWNFAVGEGREDVQQSYEIRQDNSFFGSISAETPLRPDELYNRNNNIGDPLPDYGEIEIFRF